MADAGGVMKGRAGALVACLLAVACALPALVPRIAAETEPATVAFAVPDSTLAGWASDDRNEAEIGARLKQRNVSTVVVGMTSIDSLVHSDQLAVAQRSQAPPSLADGDGSARYLRGPAGDPNDVFARAVDSLRVWYGGQVSVAEEPTPDGPIRYVRVDEADRLGAVPVGYDRGRLHALAEYDVRVVLGLPARLSTGHQWLERQLVAAQEVSGAEHVQALGELPFADVLTEQRAFAGFLADRELDLILDDLTEDPQATAYAERLPGSIVRAHTIELGRAADLEELRVRAARAVKERGVRLLVLRARIQDDNAVADLDQVLDLVERTSAAMPPPGEVGTQPSATAAVEPGTLARGGALAAALLVLAAAGSRFVGLRVPLGRNRSWVVPRAVVGAGFGVLAVLAGAAWLTEHPTVVSGVQLATAVAGAVLAVLIAVPVGRSAAVRPAAARGRLGWRRVLARYGAGAGIATATGLVLAGLGSRSVFVVGAETFSGVRVLLLAPPLTVAAYGVATTLATPDGGRGLSTLVRGLRPVHGLVAALILGGTAYYLLRAGNYGLAPGFELWLRDQLDEALYVRPRFKEMLLGFPALVLAVSWRGVVGRWCFAALAAIGTASVVDTFVHFHTPVFAALLRTGYSVLIGLLVGLVAMWIAPPAWRWWRRRLVGRLMQRHRAAEIDARETGAG